MEKTKAFIKRIMNRGGCAYINKLKSMPDSYTEWKALKNNNVKESTASKCGNYCLSSIGQDFFFV